MEKDNAEVLHAFYAERARLRNDGDLVGTEVRATVCSPAAMDKSERVKMKKKDL